ncbi:Prefoldin alpha subunit [Rozella allomycis CSF55]|uniref:Prefoldin alpha subunit n=1 Tax=Rozella allomycis (strain CSF55) TaxID=988480 RepID=A0A4P9YG41_ROZAC|nr:Prefoldin alpha subunit [Rozella allomycis CSF55]
MTSEPTGTEAVNALLQMPLQQLQQIKAQIDQDLNVLTSSFSQLKIAQAKFYKSHECLDTFVPANAGKISLNATPDKEVFIPLTQSLYVPGKMSNINKVAVDIGTGYFAEKSVADAREYFKRKTEFIQNQLSKLQESVAEKKNQLQVVLDVINVKVSNEAKANTSAKLECEIEFILVFYDTHLLEWLGHNLTMDEAAAKRLERKKKILERSENRLSMLSANFAGKEDDAQWIAEREQVLKERISVQKVENEDEQTLQSVRAREVDDKEDTVKSQPDEIHSVQSVKEESSIELIKSFVLLKTVLLVFLSIVSCFMYYDSVIVSTLFVGIEIVTLVTTRRISIKEVLEDFACFVFPAMIISIAKSKI